MQAHPGYGGDRHQGSSVAIWGKWFRERQAEIEQEVEMARHTHAIVAAIEDLVAVALEAKLEAEIALYRLRQRQNGMALEEAETALLFVVVRLTKMIDILHKARRGPHAYRRNEPQDLDAEAK